MSVIIIGGGCAGLSAAIYCARAGLSPLVFCGGFDDKGGLLAKTSVVENYPGFAEGILGYDLMTSMESQAIKYGAIIKNVSVTLVSKIGSRYSVCDYNGTVYETDTVIIATGSTPVKLNLYGEDRLWGKGISSCAVCDGALYRGKNIVVVGGGDSACEEAQFLSRFSSVTMIHRRSTLRASLAMQNKVLQNPKITILYNTEVVAFYGTESLVNIDIRDKDGVHTIPVDGLFYGLGLTPNSALFNGLVDIDSDGYIRNYNGTQTSSPGIFVCGDVCDKKYRQAIVAAGDGCRAALDVISYLGL